MAGMCKQETRYRSSLVPVLLGLGLVLAAAEPGRAGLPTPDDVLSRLFEIRIQAFDDDDFFDDDRFSILTIEADEFGIYEAIIEERVAGGTDRVIYLELRGDFDPLTEIAGTFSNPTAEPLNFLWETRMVTTPVSGAPWMVDAFLEIELVDNNDDGVQLTAAQPLFSTDSIPPLLAVGLQSDEALPTVSLLSDLTEGATTLSGAGVYTFDPNSVFLPDPPEGAAWRQLPFAGGFRLTAGDSAIIRARADQVIPEPGTLAPLGLGVAPLLARCRPAPVRNR